MKRFSLLAAMVLLAIAVPFAAMWSYAREPASPDQKQKESAAHASEERQQLLETVGTLAGFQLYQSYLNIGLIADGKAEGVYSDEDVSTILNSVLELLETLDKRLEANSKLALSDSDQSAIKKLRLLSALLRQEGDELKAFWRTGDKAHSDKYEAARKEAWEGISEVLGLNR
jgi:hypothetical protein